MSLVKDFIEKNKPLIESMVEDNPELGNSIIDALAVLNNFIEDNKVVFTDEQVKDILEGVKIEAVEPPKEDVSAELKNISEIVQSSTPQPTEVATWELLQLDYIQDADDTDTFPNYASFWDSVKKFTYENDPSKIPDRGYDKLYLNVKYFGRVGFLAERDRIDIGTNDFNPFESENIFFDSKVRSYVYKVMFVYFGLGNKKSKLGSVTELEYMLGYGIVLFNLDFSVSREYFAQYLMSSLKEYLNSDYWNKHVVERRDTELDSSEITDDLMKKYRKMGTFIDDEVKEILKPYVPKPIYDWLYNNADLEIKKVYDLAWFTPNEDGDIEYFKNQLGMPFDYQKAYGFESAPSVSKVATPQSNDWEITRTDYFSEHLPKDPTENTRVVQDILKKLVELARTQNVRLTLVTSTDVKIQLVIKYDGTNPSTPYTLRGDMASAYQDSYEIMVGFENTLLRSQFKSITIQLDSGVSDKILDVIFVDLNHSTTPQPATQPTTTTTPKKRGMKPKHTKVSTPIVVSENDVFLEEETDEDVSAEDIENLDTIGEIENDDDFSLLEDLLK